MPRKRKARPGRPEGSRAGWARVPNTLWGMLKDGAITPATYLVYCGLTHHKHRNSYAYPSVTYLAYILRLHRHTVQDCIRTLRGYGLVIVEPGDPGEVNRYRLPDLAAVDPGLPEAQGGGLPEAQGWAPKSPGVGSQKPTN